jgi:hypothetical protein
MTIARFASCVKLTNHQRETCSSAHVRYLVLELCHSSGSATLSKHYMVFFYYVITLNNYMREGGFCRYATCCTEVGRNVG